MARNRKDMEYTLEDAFEVLKSKKAELEKSIEDLISKISNNEVLSLKPSISQEELRTKQNKLEQSLRREIQRVEPEDYPIPRTSDLRLEVMTEMEEAVRDMQDLLGSTQRRLTDIQEDIVYLRNKKSDLDKMLNEKAQDTTEISGNKMYEKECALAKQTFQQVKADLYTVVDTLFQGNDSFKELLAALTSAYMKGGDDSYIDVMPNILNYINFLLEADIVQYHPNDKTKIKMTELL